MGCMLVYSGVLKFFFTVNFFFFFWHAACGILVPQPEIEPVPLALGAQSLNHWMFGEAPRFFSLNF